MSLEHERLAEDIASRISDAYHEHPDYTADQPDGFSGGMLLHAIVITTWVGGDGDRWFDTLATPDVRVWDARGMLHQALHDIDEGDEA